VTHHQCRISQLHWVSIGSQFRKVCPGRFRSYRRINPRLPARASTCFEGPFGEVIRATGPLAKANPFRFSTKYQDDETDLLYYGFRYYNASTGRWSSRDPAEQQGAGNLYGFARNDPCGAFDRDGRISVRAVTTKPSTCCGSANDVEFAFVLDNPAAEDGYIIQENTASIPWDSCDGFLHGNLWTDHYWEAFPVAKLSSGPAEHDHVWWIGKNKSSGDGGIKGNLKFFFKSHKGVDDLKDWTTKISSPSSGGLLSTRRPPDWWDDPSDNGEHDATRSVSVAWDCCCQGNISFLSVSPGGYTGVGRGPCK
jgi:RHS repeat-associated protein